LAKQYADEEAELKSQTADVAALAAELAAAESASAELAAAADAARSAAQEQQEALQQEVRHRQFMLVTSVDRYALGIELALVCMFACRNIWGAWYPLC
jgi:hypothetical protein